MKSGQGREGKAGIVRGGKRPSLFLKFLDAALVRGRQGELPVLPANDL